MAKKLVLVEGKSVIKYSKTRRPASYYEGLDLGSTYSQYGGKDKNILIEEIKKFGVNISKYQITGMDLHSFDFSATDGTTPSSFKFLSDKNLQSYDKKSLKTILSTLSKFNLLLKDFKSKESLLNSFAGVQVKQKYERAIKCYIETFDKVDNSLDNSHKLENFDTSAFARDIDRAYTDLSNASIEAVTIDSNLGLSHRRDLEVVRALEFTGINLRRVKNAQGIFEWAIDGDATNKNQNGLTYLDSSNQTQYVKIPSAEIQSFLDNYLNLPVSRRNGAVITADGIFQLYLEEATSGIKPMRGSDGSMINDAIKQAQAKYSTKNPDWNTYLLTADRMAIVDASKLALMDIYRGEQGLGGAENQEDFEILQDEIQTNDLLGKQLTRLINDASRIDMHISNEKELEYPEAEEIILNYTSRKEDLETRLTSVNLSSEVRAQLSNELEDIDRSIATISIVREFTSKVALQLSNGDKSKALQIINNLSESDFINIVGNKETGYEIQLNPNKTMSAELEDACKTALEDIKMSSLAVENNQAENNDSISENSSTAETNAEVSSSSEQDLMNLILENCTNDKENNVAGNRIKEYLSYQFGKTFLEENKDNEIWDVINKFRQAKKLAPDNPKFSTFKDFLDSYKSEDGQVIEFANPIMTNDALSIYEALTRENTEEYGQSDDYKKASSAEQAIVGSGKQFLQLLAKVRGGIEELDPEIIKNGVSENVVNEIYNQVANDIRSAGGINLTERENAYARDYEKYLDSAFKSNIAETLENNTNSADANSKFKQQAVQMFAKSAPKSESNEEKENSSEENVSGENSEKENNKSNESTETRIKFSAKYPKDKTGELLKKFKPYCEKSTGKIIENLMKLIEGCDIIIKEAPKASATDSNIEPPKTNVISSGNNLDLEEPEDASNSDADSNDEVNNSEENIGENSSDNQSENDSSSEEKQNEDNSQDNENSDKANTEQENSDNAPDNNGGATENADNSEENNNLQENENINKQSNDTQNTVEGVFAEENQIGISDGEFATYKVLSLGLSAVLKSSSFEQNRKWLNEDEINKIKSLSKVMGYIITPTRFAKDTKEYEDDLKLKNFLASEISYKSRTLEKNYNPGITGRNEEFYKSEFGNVLTEDVFENINYVMQNCKNIDDIGQLMCITTDITSPTDNSIGNNLTKEEIQAIVDCKTKEELWAYIRGNKKLFDRGLWTVPALMSSKLTMAVRDNLKEDNNNSETESTNTENVNNPNNAEQEDGLDR